MKERSLEDICEKDPFQKKVNGNHYCGIKMAQKIGCRYQANQKDQNGLYPCIRAFSVEDFEKSY